MGNSPSISATAMHTGTHSRKQRCEIYTRAYFGGGGEVGEFSRVIFHANFMSIELCNTERAMERRTHYEANRRIFLHLTFWERRSQWLRDLRRRSVFRSHAEIVASNPTSGMVVR